MSEVYTLVTLESGDTYDVLESPDRVDADMDQHLSSGGTRDYLIQLTSVDGDRLRIRASRIDTVAQSTPEGRAKRQEVERALAEELKANQRAAGYVPGQED